MPAHQTASPAPTDNGQPACRIGPTCPPAITDHGRWTAQRLAVINDAAGICARCGITGADTVVRGRSTNNSSRHIRGCGRPRPRPPGT